MPVPGGDPRRIPAYGRNMVRVSITILLFAFLSVSCGGGEEAPGGGEEGGPTSGTAPRQARFFDPLPLDEPWAASRALYRFSRGEALGRLIERLPGGTTARAWRFAKGFLSRLHDPDVIERVGAYLDTWLLGSLDTAPLLNGLEVMEGSGDERYDPWIRKAIGHPKGRVQAAALKALERCAKPETVAALCDRFDRVTPGSRIRILRILIKAGKPSVAVPFLRSVLAGERGLREAPELRVRILATFEEGADPQIVRGVLEGNLGRFRGKDGLLAARLLHEAGSEEGRAWLLRALAKSGDPLGTASLIAALGVRAAASSRREVADHAASESPLVRQNVAAFFGGIRDKASTRILEVLLNDEDATVQRAAARALRGRPSSSLRRLTEDLGGLSGSRFRQRLALCVDAGLAAAIPVLRRRLRDADGAERRLLLQALGHMRLPEGVPVLLEELRAPSRVLSESKKIESVGYAALMLSNIPSALEPVWKAYRELRGDPVRRSHLLGCIANLSRLEGKEDGGLHARAVRLLKRVLYDPTAPVRDRNQVLGYLKGDLDLEDWKRLKEIAEGIGKDPKGFPGIANDFLWTLF